MSSCDTNIEVANPRTGGGQEVITKTYCRRFWILLVFSLLAGFQGQQWNTWSPIGASMEAAYPGWGSSTVAMMANWGPITFLIFVAPMCWLMNTRGLRVSVVTCAAMMSVGTLLRCIHTPPAAFTALCHVCAFLVGTSGTIMLAAPPLLAADWFPPRERTTATAVPIVANQLGTALSYLEPLVVRAPGGAATPADIRSDVSTLLSVEAGIAATLLVMTVAYFPSRPPSPPSITSAAPRLEYRAALAAIVRNRDALLVFASYGLSSIPWEAVLSYYLSSLGIQQEEASWLGVVAVVSSAAAGLLAARLTDLLYGHALTCVLALMLTSVGALYWLCLLSWGTIPAAKWQIYASVIGGMAVNFGATPLFVELAVELAYPCPEGVVTGFMVAVLNFTGAVFLFLFFIPNIGYSWVVYYLLGSCVACALPLLLVREDYARSSIDRRRRLGRSLDGDADSRAC
ncbi:solute carrier family 49 member 4-like [Penaeus chinensis]|uniref:solute carrier family 49 member 4-like n=1 Tax=Penaeus chinensis TaxID=139456 RepID=UPI001FB7B631|nr:solute carrier family 49 member 4-like [Penaeus chinensis]